MSWDQSFDGECRALVERVVAGDRASWRTLLVKIAPRIEEWARGNRLLRRCRLAGDDDVRAVMVDVLERLASGEYANLKRFLARAEPDATPDELVTAVMKLGKLDEDEPRADDTAHTPLRAWLLRLVDFVARDHVRHRLGWTADASKRKVQSDHVPLSAAPDIGVRPPLTDRLTIARLVAEIQDYIATFPDDMRHAVLLWLDDDAPEDIATKLALVDAAKARALVRAAQARLRERFRGRSPLLFS